MFRYLLSFFLFSGGHIDQNGIFDYNVKKNKKKKKKKKKTLRMASQRMAWSLQPFALTVPMSSSHQSLTVFICF